jgi:uncharacterized protein YdeI (YjbR/CyaY-like superfamily)
MAKTSFKESLPLVGVQSLEELREWLRPNHDTSGGIWLVLNKKGFGLPIVTYSEVVDEGLCRGWIDSTTQKLDEKRYKIMFCPRKPRSVWSQVNKQKIERLQAEGRMQPPGQAKIDAAIADGSWDTLNEADSLAVPADLEGAFARHPGSAVRFAAFTAPSRRNILWYIYSAKRPETRAKRVEETAALAARGIRANNPADKGK